MQLKVSYRDVDILNNDIRDPTSNVQTDAFDHSSTSNLDDALVRGDFDRAFSSICICTRDPSSTTCVHNPTLPVWLVGIGAAVYGGRSAVVREISRLGDHDDGRGRISEPCHQS